MTFIIQRLQLAFLTNETKIKTCAGSEQMECFTVAYAVVFVVFSFSFYAHKYKCRGALMIDCI